MVYVQYIKCDQIGILSLEEAANILTKAPIFYFLYIFEVDKIYNGYI